MNATIVATGTSVLSYEISRCIIITADQFGFVG